MGVIPIRPKPEYEVKRANAIAAACSGWKRQPLRTGKAVLYLAGKIRKNDWRTGIVDCGIDIEDDEAKLFNPDFRIEYDSFYYGGPLFARCDHGCSHNPGQHASAACGSPDFAPDPEDMTGGWARRHQAILKVNAERIRRADLLFCFINETDCHGTLIELGIAFAQPKPMVRAVAFGPRLTEAERLDLWMAAECATHLYEGTARAAWREFAREFL
jgi:nucleoside 2-deoxyribosyltransferase